MKATGIVRLVDDLGRVHIPKEIRHRMGITEGTPLEIFIDAETNSLNFRVYHADAITAHVDDLIRSIRNTCSDKDEVNALCGELKEIRERIYNNSHSFR